MRLGSFRGIKITLASPDIIRAASYGEVKKADTINYRTQKPERDGLFCERIFGPVKDFECNCGKYRGKKYAGTICERCGVEVTTSHVRRYRMGHIELAVPVAHIWFYKVPPSRIGTLLDLSQTKLEEIIYYQSYVVLEPGESDLKKYQLISLDEYDELSAKDIKGFVAKTGGEALYDMLKELNLDEMAEELKTLLRHETSLEKKQKILKKLQIVEAFRSSGVKPEWMIIKVLPVIPPALRPLVPLEGGRYATSDLNDLYRRIITRNNRLKNLIAMRAPEIIIRNEKRMLQQAVDALLDNSRRAKPLLGRADLPLKSLSDNLRGKRGRFRQNLLGKRVDYSGRAVIVVDPTLKLYQCGLPKLMALELFKPFILHELRRHGYAESMKVARELLERGSPKVWEILEKIVHNHPVLLNRAPTLHRLSIQAFMPVLVEGKAIRISPLVCKPFNADFDGDQMAVHVPLSTQAQLETLTLILAPNNILSPAHGEPLSVPTQDVIIGLYYLTKKKKSEKSKAKFLSSPEEVEYALEVGAVTFNTIIKYNYNGKIIDTTPGRVIFNNLLPEDMRFINKTIDKNELNKIISDIYNKYGSERACKFLDDIKDLGFEIATISGLTLGLDDLKSPPEKSKIIERTEHEVQKIHER